jgi:tektin-1
MVWIRVRQAVASVPPPTHHFTLSEWYLNNRHCYTAAEYQQQIADRVIAESNHLCDLISDVTKFNKAEVDNTLKDRIKDTAYQKTENEIQKKECCKEEETLLVYKGRIMDAIESLKEHMLRICKKCTTLR